MPENLPKKISKKFRKKKDAGDIRVPVSESDRATVECLSERLGISMAEVLRRGLPLLVREVEHVAAGGDVSDLYMRGDAETLRWKREFLQAIEESPGIARAARAAGVKPDTARYHLANDPAFALQFKDAQDFCVEEVEHCLYKMATGKKPNITAVLAFLNAKHPDYGIIRTQLLQRVLAPFLERLAKLAEKYVPPGLLPEYIEDLRKDSDFVVIEVGR